MRVVVAVVALVSACGFDQSLDGPPSCSAVGAAEGLVLHIAVDGAPLPPDHYQLVVSADGAQLALSFTIQIAPNGSADDRVVITPAGKELHAAGELTSTAGDVNVFYRDGAGPVQVSFDLSDSVGAVAHADFTPTYVLDEPNGPACDPHAHNATATWTITP